MLWDERPSFLQWFLDYFAFFKSNAWSHLGQGSQIIGYKKHRNTLMTKHFQMLN